MTRETSPVEASAEISSDARILRVIADIIAPLVERDGGKITYVGRRGDIVEVSLSGACRGCPGQGMTLRGVVLPALRVAAPEIRDVTAVPMRHA